MKESYITINLITLFVEHVRDTPEEAQEAAAGDDTISFYPYPVPEPVASGDEITEEMFKYVISSRRDIPYTSRV